jgi:hypothetical protein
VGGIIFIIRIFFIKHHGRSTSCAQARHFRLRTCAKLCQLHPACAAQNRTTARQWPQCVLVIILITPAQLVVIGDHENEISRHPTTSQRLFDLPSHITTSTQHTT